MTSPRFRRRRPPAFRGDFPDDGQAVTEILQAVQPAAWDGTTIAYRGASDQGLRPGDVYPEPDPAAGLRQAVELTAMAERGAPPAARLRAVPQEAPPRYAPQDPRDTGPQQRMPRLSRVRERPRPARPSDCAIFIWSAVLSQHIMLCGVCLRSRYADPISAHMPFAFEALRVSAHVSRWRLDAFGRWACPACQLTPAWHSPGAVTHSHPGIRRRKLAGEDLSLSMEAAAIAVAEHDLILDVAGAANHGKHAGSPR